MSNILEITTNSSKKLTNDLEHDLKFETITNELDSGVSKAIDNVSKYIIKALPIPDCAKDVLLDVKNALKTKDIKTILKTAVKSSVREGLELLGLDKKTINSVFKLKDIAVKGGLGYKLKNSLEIIAKKFLEGNIVTEGIGMFFKNLKQFVVSNKFIRGIENVLKKLNEKKEKFLEQVKEWKANYENMNVDKMNSIASKLNRKKEVIEQYPECEKANGVVQNITSMVNAKRKNLCENEKLSEIQLQLCTTL